MASVRLWLRTLVVDTDAQYLRPLPSVAAYAWSSAWGRARTRPFTVLANDLLSCDPNKAHCPNPPLGHVADLVARHCRKIIAKEKLPYDGRCASFCHAGGANSLVAGPSVVQRNEIFKVFIPALRVLIESAHDNGRHLCEVTVSALMSASLIGHWGQAPSDYPPLQCRCRSRARASLRNRH